tara:strand:- start:1026 stop:1256 length:231 start_codon:yes stop_codon:yes gene_type:complete
MSTSVILFFSTMITALFFVVGVTIGWTANDFLYNMLTPEPELHPEMYDSEGLVINEELLSVRFVDDLDESEEYYDD